MYEFLHLNSHVDQNNELFKSEQNWRTCISKNQKFLICPFYEMWNKIMCTFYFYIKCMCVCRENLNQPEFLISPVVQVSIFNQSVTCHDLYFGPSMWDSSARELYSTSVSRYPLQSTSSTRHLTGKQVMNWIKRTFCFSENRRTSSGRVGNWFIKQVWILCSDIIRPIQWLHEYDDWMQSYLHQGFKTEFLQESTNILIVWMKSFP